MDIECLEFFEKIARMKSISKVADKCHISQSALSQQIQKLEDILGYKLFIRSNRGVELTDKGETVLKYTDNIIRTFNKMRGELESQKSAQHDIKIEAAWAIATYCLPCALYKMKEKYPAHNYDLISNKPEKIAQDVMNDICDIGFTTICPSDERILCHEVINEKVVLITLPDKNMPEKIKLEEIIDYPVITLSGKCIIKDNLNNCLKEIGYSFDNLNIVFELESTEAVKKLVTKGYGLALVPYNSIKKELFMKELSISIISDFNLDYNIYMLSKVDAELNNITREFIEGFKELGDNICC